MKNLFHIGEQLIINFVLVSGIQQSNSDKHIHVSILFQILKDDALKVLHSIGQQVWKSQQWPQDCKRSVFISIPKNEKAKECSNYCMIVLVSHTNKVRLKIFQARLQQYMNCELPDVYAGYRKCRVTRDRIANIPWILKKQQSSRKTSISALLTMPKPLTVWITIN